jgi:hypothetical protein
VAVTCLTTFLPFLDDDNVLPKIVVRKKRTARSQGQWQGSDAATVLGDPTSLRRQPYEFDARGRTLYRQELSRVKASRFAFVPTDRT